MFGELLFTLFCFTMTLISMAHDIYGTLYGCLLTLFTKIQMALGSCDPTPSNVPGVIQFAFCEFLEDAVKQKWSAKCTLSRSVLLERIGVRKVTIHDVKISKLHTKIRS
jgi:hypothetical protein